MPGSSADEKRRLRRTLQARRRAVATEAARAAARSVAGHVAATPEFGAARRVVLYAPLAHELPIEPLLDRCRRAGKRVLWPRMGPRGVLEFAASDGLDTLQPGTFGVREPDPGAPAEPLGADTLVLVPGVGFDRGGRRLGRGLGVFDRALAQLARSGAPICFGVGYDFQLVDRVPEDPWDRRMDAVVTESGVYRAEEDRT